MFRLSLVLLAAGCCASAQKTPHKTMFVAYGDMRFTDPAETQATNPKVRKWLVEKIASEHPQAIVVSGDVPYVGGRAADYAQYHAETEPWRAANIPVYPAIGNHEMRGDPQKCLENWWTEFPQLRGKRWYTSEIGDRIVVISLDTSSPLTLGSEQIKWVDQQLINLKKPVRFVIFNLHHPPVADIETGDGASHNPRPNEIALAEYLTSAPQSKRIRFIVNAGHIHNYERFLHDGTVFLVSGGGGAAPLAVTRTVDDLYKGAEFPNYHYLRFELRGKKLHAEMIRVVDPAADAPQWQVKDRFQVSALK